MLNIDSAHVLFSLYNRRLSKRLTASQFFYYSCFLKLSFELFQRLFNVLAFFQWNYDHDLMYYII